MTHYRPQLIYIERAVEHSLITRNVLAQLPEVPVRLIESCDPLLDHSRRRNPSIPQAKRSLVLARHKGKFFKPCPASQTRGEVRNACCNYFVVNYASNCHMECSYCYLQSYLNFPYMIIYANHEDLLGELEMMFTERPSEYFRVGTGELADSLALDRLTGYSAPLVEFFARQPKALLEFKTKSDCVENLLSLDHQGRTVASWSINPRFVQEREEHKTATIDQRLMAAERCASAGYPIAFHLDPIVYYPRWEEDYRSLVKEIFGRIPARQIAWMSIGALRMTSQLREFMRQRFPRSFLPLGELVPTEDGKMRYFKPIRVRMLSRVAQWIREAGPNTPVYSCMEKPEVWQQIFGSAHPGDQSVGNQLVELLV